MSRSCAHEPACNASRVVRGLIGDHLVLGLATCRTCGRWRVRSSQSRSICVDIVVGGLERTAPLSLQESPESLGLLEVVKCLVGFGLVPAATACASLSEKLPSSWCTGSGCRNGVMLRAPAQEDYVIGLPAATLVASYCSRSGLSNSGSFKS